jgi:serine/threonine-protein kinase
MLPERFGRYEVLAEIGDGAMGRVYSAWDPKVSRLVAVKTLKPELLTSDTAADYLKRFRREAQAAGALNHPHVVRVFDVGADFLVMEYVEGRTLHALVREAGRVEPGETLRLLGPVADALDHAHRAGIVHRDVKPANVIVQPDGQPKLMDFGVAHLAASVMTVAGQVLGSPSYMPPEQIAGLEVTGRCDVYSLAVVAYEMLTGQPPFSGQTITQVIYRVMNESAPPPRRLNAALPARYDEVFARGLAKDPGARYATAGELLAALDLRELELTLTAFDSPSPGASPAQPDDVPTLVSDPRGASPALARPARAAPFRASLLPAAAAAALAVGALGWSAIGRGREPRAVTSEPAAAAAAVAAASAAAIPPATVPPAPPRPSPRRAAAPQAAAPRLAAGAAPAPPSATGPTGRPAVAGQLVELSDDVTPPVRTRGGPAPYPERARAQRLTGTVAIAMVVDEAGVPTELEVTESAGVVLDQAVLDAVRQWRFEPARKGGVPVKVRWTARQTYRHARP